MSEWERLPRFSKLASILYPAQVEADRRKEMDTVLRGEKRRPSEGPALLSDEKRGAVSKLGGVAKPWGKR
jgi:hypothetical protein